MAQTSRSSISSYQKFVKVAATSVIAIGCLVLIGWVFNIVIFKSILPGLVTMKANSALGFVLAGISLALSRWEQVKIQNSKFKIQNRILLTSTFIIYTSSFIWR